MDKQFIYGKDLDDLQERHPAAYNFLLDRVLQNEYLAVTKELQMLKRKCNPEQLRRGRWLLERENQLAQLFRLVQNGSQVTIEHRPTHEFGTVKP